MLLFTLFKLHYIQVSLYAVCTDVIELVPSSDPVVTWHLYDTVGLGVSLILSYIVLDTSVAVCWLSCEGGTTCTVDIITGILDESFCL